MRIIQQLWWVTPENPYQNKNLAENQNRYIGVTTVGQNAHLIQGINNALGSEAIHTQLLAFAKGEDGTTGSYDLMGFTQTVGGLDVAEGAVVNLTAPDGTDEAPQGSTGES